jgi:hypothetical protein
MNTHRFPKPLLEYRLDTLYALSVGEDPLPGDLERTCCSTQRTRVELFRERNARFPLFSPCPVDRLRLLLTQRSEESVGTPLEERGRESVRITLAEKRRREKIGGERTVISPSPFSLLQYRSHSGLPYLLSATL